MTAPLVYLYCQKVVFDKSFSRGDFIHLVPILLCYAVNADTLFLYHEQFRQWVVGLAPAPTNRIWLIEYLQFFVALFYMFAAARLLKRYHKKASDTYSNFDPAIFRWLGFLIGASTSIWLIKAVLSLANISIAILLIISDVLIVILIYVIAWAHWRRPTLFNVANGGDIELNLATAKVDKADIASDGALDKDTRAALFDAIKSQFERDALYRDSDLTLTKLADLTGVSPHHLSEVLNQHAGQNFNHFVNAYRVDEVCRRFESASSTKVLDVALEAGFSSKSTFNYIFKKIKGVTPTQFRRQIQL
jgi:AraC-like DNA-binding protein